MGPDSDKSSNTNPNSLNPHQVYQHRCEYLMQTLTISQKIRIEQDDLVVESFTTHDPDIVSFFRDKKKEECEQFLETALKAGCIALRSVAVAEKIDYIQKEFGKLDYTFSTNLKDTLNQLDNRYNDYFGEKGKISELINAHFGENGKIVKEIFDPEREGTPLFNLKQDFKRELSDLREKFGIKEKEHELTAKTTLKGYEFEEFCSQTLSEITRLNGDELEQTTDKGGTLPRSKKGDYVVTLAGKNPRKIVFEMKNISAISLPEIHATLEESIKNRDASYGILVTKNIEALPESIGWFNEYSGNQLVCALSTKESAEVTNPEILRIAYRWAKMRALLESSGDEGLDVSKVKEFVAKLQSELQKFTKIRTQCGTIEKSAKDIKIISDDVKDSINEGITDIMKALSENNP